MATSKKAEKERVEFGPPVSIPPYEWFHGPQATLSGRVYFGASPAHARTLAEMEKAKAEGRASEMVCAQSGGHTHHTTVRIARIPPGHGASGGGVVGEAPAGRFKIGLFLDDDLAIEMEPEAFVEAFLAVVPRWFWKPKDERP